MAYAVTARMRLIACGSMIPAHFSVGCVRPPGAAGAHNVQNEEKYRSAES
jgi:hypothetical protein